MFEQELDALMSTPIAGPGLPFGQAEALPPMPMPPVQLPWGSS